MQRSRIASCLVVLVVTMAILSSPISAGEIDQESEMEDAQWPDISGEWSAEAVTVASSRLPMLGVIETTTRAIVEMSIEQNGNQLEMVQRTRSLQVESSTSVVRTIISDAFVASLPEVRRQGELRRSGDRVEVVFPRPVTSQGVRLQDSDSEALPTDADDGRVFDQDGDGNPGLTVRIEGVVNGNLYVIRRGWDEWHGVIDDTGVVQGAIRWDMDQVVLGATSRFLRSQPQTRPENEKSYFRMRP